MQVKNCASHCNCFGFYVIFPLKRKQEEENPVKLVRHPRCFQVFPFHPETSAQAHYRVGGSPSFTLHLADGVKSAREDLRRRALPNGAASMSSDGS